MVPCADRRSAAVHDLPDRPDEVFGLPGMFGMDQFDPYDLPKATRWDFENGPNGPEFAAISREAEFTAAGASHGKPWGDPRVSLDGNR